MGARDSRLEAVDAAAPPQRAGDGRHLGPIAIVADADRHGAGEIDAVDPGEKPMNEMLSRLFAVGDDIDAGVLLLLQRQHGGVALGFGERLALGAPGRP